MEDKDVSNYSSSSSHRLPTVSASQALQKLTSSRFRTISTGLDQLDAVLQGHDADSTNPPAAAGGLSRGEVAEVYGPPGVGKTHLLMQASAGALHAGDSVIWIDTSHQLVRSRFIEMISSFRLPENHEPPSSPPTTRSMPELLDNFHHFTAPTLPHLLALIAHPSLSFPPEKTSLIVVDSISAIFATAFPRVIENYDGNQGSAKKNDILQWAASRRWSVMGDLISRMGKLAAIKNLAICLISQTTTKIRPETGAVIRPAISGKAWDDGIASRILILRDWSRAIEDSLSRGEQLHGIRFAGVIKAGGISYSGMGKVVIFTIGRHGLEDVIVDPGRKKPDISTVPQAPPLKRKRDEIADSQSEEDGAGSDDEFGWPDEDGPVGAEGLDEDG